MTVSKGAEEDREDVQVFLTQAFEIPYPAGVEPGSEEAEAQEKHLSVVARRNVVSNIKSFRDLKEKNKL